MFLVSQLKKCHAEMAEIPLRDTVPLLDLGIRQPLRGFKFWGACGDLNLPSLPTRDPPKPSASSSKRHKDTEIYTGSGHRCGVIP